MNTYLGANRDFCPDDVIESEVSGADFFHFTGYMWDTQNQMEAIRKTLAIAKRNNVRVSFDIADPFAVGRYHDAFLEIIKDSCDIVFANKEEARMLFDNYDPYECCKTMGKLCETAIVKNGKKGSTTQKKHNMLLFFLCRCMLIFPAGSHPMWFLSCLSDGMRSCTSWHSPSHTFFSDTSATTVS